MTQCNNSGVCNNSSTETVNCSSGQACSGGSCSSSYYCDEGSWSCDGNCSRTLARLQCSAGSCNVDAGVVDHCATGTTCTNGSCSGEANCGSAVTYCGSNPCAVSTWYPQCSGSGTCSSDHAATTSSTCPAGTNCYELWGVGACSSLMGATACPYTDQCVGDCGRQRVRYMCDGSGPSASACTQLYSTQNLGDCGYNERCSAGLCVEGHKSTIEGCVVGRCKIGKWAEHCDGSETLLEILEICTGGRCNYLGSVPYCAADYCCYKPTGELGCIYERRCIDGCSLQWFTAVCSESGTCDEFTRPTDLGPTHCGQYCTCRTDACAGRCYDGDCICRSYWCDWAWPECIVDCP